MPDALRDCVCVSFKSKSSGIASRINRSGNSPGSLTPSSAGSTSVNSRRRSDRIRFAPKHELTQSLNASVQSDHPPQNAGLNHQCRWFDLLDPLLYCRTPIHDSPQIDFAEIIAHS